MAANKSSVDVIDIRSDDSEISVTKETQKCLQADPPSLPSLLLWDEQGLKNFEAVTYGPQYYLTGCEIELLQKHSHEIASMIEPDTVLLELGSGNLRKIKILLEAIDDLRKPVDYYALDLSRVELERTLQAVRPGTFQHVKCHGLLGTYDDGLNWLQKYDIASRPRAVLSIGSTLGSFTRTECAKFLRDFAEALNRSANGAMLMEPLVIIGLDGCKNADKVWQAYNDRDGRNDRFIKNALRHTGRVLAEDVSEQEWDRIGGWHAEAGRHEQYLVPQRDITVNGQSFQADDKLFVVASHKYGTEEREQLWHAAGLWQLKGWRTAEHDYGLYALSTQLRN